MNFRGILIFEFSCHLIPATFCLKVVKKLRLSSFKVITIDSIRVNFTEIIDKSQRQDELWEYYSVQIHNKWMKKQQPARKSKCSFWRILISEISHVHGYSFGRVFQINTGNISWRSTDVIIIRPLELWTGWR